MLGRLASICQSTIKSITIKLNLNSFGYKFLSCLVRQALEELRQTIRLPVTLQVVFFIQDRDFTQSQVMETSCATWYFRTIVWDRSRRGHSANQMYANWPEKWCCMHSYSVCESHVYQTLDHFLTFKLSSLFDVKKFSMRYQGINSQIILVWRR